MEGSVGLYRGRGAIVVVVGVEICWIWIRGHVCDAETRNGKGRDWTVCELSWDGMELGRKYKG